MKTPPKEMDVWVLAGQSNMQGCGWLEGALEPDERVWNFASAGRWEVANEPLHRLWESFTPVHRELMRPWLADSDKQLSDEELARRESETRKTGAGLGISFGKAMADALGRPVGLVAAAHGGSSLDQWSPGLKEHGGRSLYGAMLERIRHAGGRLRGILWYQGESDASTADLGRSYGERFDAWVSAVRSDVGIEGLPVIAVQIGRVVEPANRQGVWPGWDLVREALGNLPRRVPHTAATSAVDLGMADPIHIDTPSLIRLGKRMAAVALKLTQQPALAGGPAVAGIERCQTPTGSRNALRVRFEGVTGSWRQRRDISGFEVRIPDAELRNSLFVVNAWADDSHGADGTDVIVLLNREADDDAKLGYGVGLNPVCSLTDKADLPLCSFLPRAVAQCAGTTSR